MKKYIFLVLSIFVLSIGLSACSDNEESTPNTQQVSTSQQEKPAVEKKEEEKKSALIIEQINPNGTSQEVMRIGTEENEKGTQEETSDLVVEGVKGIAIANGEFAPKELTVKVGTKVVFHNSDKKEHWPDADPKEGVCEAFKVSKELNKGEFYETVFETVGVCPFFDKLNPEMNGVITVVEDK